jgi:hypothetical protein
MTAEEMMLVDGGVTWQEAVDMVAIAASIVGIAWAPVLIIAAVGPVAILLAAAGGLTSMIGLVSSLT